MELAVTHAVRRRPSSPDALFGSCPSKAASPSSAVAAGAVPLLGGTARFDDAQTIASKPNDPVPAAPSLDTETNRPQRTLDSAQERSSETRSEVQPRRACSILVVEDDADIAMALQDQLEFEGFRVDCAQTCRDAFLSIERNAYNAILLDLELPDGDGRSILQKVQVSHPSLPVIVLTASSKDLGPWRAYARLTKPWERGELCRILHRAIGTAPSSTAG